jgi:hypothetical protein
MSDLISRSAAKEKFQEWFGAVYIPKVTDAFFDEIPAVDAVEVVRCKDCKNYLAFGGGYAGVGGCMIDGRFVSDDFYCKDGERKADATD